jgi:DNA invertase Pin-like site-specific DNA recombinase
MRAAIYTRVSTRGVSRYGDKTAFDQNPEVQEAPLRAFIESRGWTVEKVYSDRESGRKSDRPALKQLMAAARRREIDVIVVWRFDRMSRSTKHFLEVVEELRTLGVDLVSHSQAFDSTTPMGKFTLTMFAALGELEAEVIKERVLAGLDYARKHGTKSGNAIGRPKRIFNRDEVRQLHSEGRSTRAIGELLGLSKDTVGRALAEAA